MPVGVILAEAPSGRLVLGNRRAEEIWRHPFIASSETGGVPRDTRASTPTAEPYQPDEWPLARSLATGEEVHGEEIDFLRGDDTSGRDVGQLCADLRSGEADYRGGRVVRGCYASGFEERARAAPHPRRTGQPADREPDARVDA